MDVIDQLETLLHEERQAIRRLDGPAVVAFAERKRELFDDIENTWTTFGDERVARLRALLPAMRQNGVLLAHARAILRDAVIVASGASITARPEGPAPRNMISVRG